MYDFMGGNSFWADNETDWDNIGITSGIELGRKSRVIGKSNLSYHLIKNLWTKDVKLFWKWNP